MTLLLEVDGTIFDPVGRCIYCGNEHATLTDEHLIPLGLGGKHIMPKASCKEKCNKITGRFEGVVQRTIYGDFRIRNRLPTRRPRERPKTREIGVVTESGAATKHVPADEFPAPMWVYLFGMAGILLNAPEHLDVSNGNMATIHNGEELTTFAAKHGWDRTTSMRYMPNEFRRMLLKIGHGYAVATLGYDGFRHIAVPYFMEEGRNLSYLVGQNSEFEPMMSGGWHVIRLHTRRIISGQLAVVAEIRLFSSTGTPTYHAVVGQIESREQKLAAIEKLRHTSRVMPPLDVGQAAPVGSVIGTLPLHSGVKFRAKRVE